jgi:hypothetical protein
LGEAHPADLRLHLKCDEGDVVAGWVGGRAGDDERLDGRRAFRADPPERQPGHHVDAALVVLLQQTGPPIRAGGALGRSFSGQGQDGGASAPLHHFADRLGGAAIDPKRRQRAEMLARGGGEAAVHGGIADGHEDALLLGDRRREDLPPDAHDGGAGQGAPMVFEQAADDGGFPSRPQRAAFLRIRHPLHDRGALREQVEDAVIQPVQRLAKGGEAILERKGGVIRAGSGFGRTRHRWLTGRLQDHD